MGRGRQDSTPVVNSTDGAAKKYSRMLKYDE